MLHEDYLMRTIRALTQAFLNMVGATDTSPAQLRFQVDETLGEHFGTQPELVPTLELDRLEDEPEEVCGELGRLFALQARLCRQLGDQMREAIAVRWALASFRRGLKVEVPVEIEEAAFDLLRSDSADEHAHPLDVRECYVALFRSGARSMRLEHAEDAIFAAAELGASESVVAEARDFFCGVLQSTDLDDVGMDEGELRQIVEELESLNR